MAKRKNPIENTVSRAGNYSAPVDTAGMDSSMKETFKTRKMSDKEYIAAQRARVNAFRAKRGKKPL